MSEISESNDNLSSQDQNIVPGERLRIAREESGLSCSEVASHLKLSVEKIHSLERGDVDDLAAPVFVAGYLRAYAKLVGLPEDEIIAEFKALSTMRAPSVDPSTSPAANNYGQMRSVSSGNGVRRRGKDWGPVAIWGSVAIVLFVVLFIVFTGDEPETLSEQDQNTEQIESAIATVNEAIAENDRAPVIDDTMAENVPESASDQKPITEQNNIASINEQSVQSVTVGNKLTKNTLNENTDNKNLKHSVIVFNFNEDSWVEVNDSRGNRLLYRTGKAGTANTVWGVSPFRVHLGFAPGVEVIFNGEPYDMSRFSDRRRVRFTLGEKGDSMASN